MIYLISIAVALSVVLVLVGVLLLVESRVVIKGDRTITINDDETKTITATGSSTLLGTLLENDILLPCACGGKGSCGTCKCVVTDGGGSILPTELSLVNRAERLNNVRLACQVKVKQDMRIQIPDEIFSIEKYTGKVVSNQNVATFIKELVVKLDPDQTIDFEAGAYMQIDIPEYSARYADFKVEEEYLGAWEHFGLLELEAVNEEPELRAYSLANPPAEQGILKFTIRIASPPPNKPDAPPGIGSSYVYSLKPGDSITLSGPYGDFFAKKSDREMCFIGGGAGMAPMRSHILHQLLTLNTDRTVTFWYGARSKSEMFYDEEFTKLVQKFPNFNYHVALSDPQPEDNWDGMTGFIHQVVYEHYLAEHEDPTEIEYYICGPPLMMSAVTAMLDSLGVEPEMIDFDDFGG
jgi:Na+-transporting NADH:ubiquinone oxidoreductase subunit F